MKSFWYKELIRTSSYFFLSTYSFLSFLSSWIKRLFERQLQKLCVSSDLSFIDLSLFSSHWCFVRGLNKHQAGWKWYFGLFKIYNNFLSSPFSFFLRFVFCLSVLSCDWTDDRMVCSEVCREDDRLAPERLSTPPSWISSSANATRDPPSWIFCDYCLFIVADIHNL